MNTITDKLDLPALNQMFETSDPLRIIEWSAAQFGDEMVMSSSFGEDSASLIHLVNRVKPGIRIIFVNTGYHFPETLAFMEQLRQRFNLNVWTFNARAAIRLPICTTQAKKIQPGEKTSTPAAPSTRPSHLSAQ